MSIAWHAKDDGIGACWNMKKKKKEKIDPIFTEEL